MKLWIFVVTYNEYFIEENFNFHWNLKYFSVRKKLTRIVSFKKKEKKGKEKLKEKSNNLKKNRKQF